ncbi:large ribosomal subunit protein mL53 [Sebastes fasciatus]|uniref:large ribosomal subunit protein mL53 n=1 Tax=Sebastes fasciatus TaxID=394691 RepID=UPI003D9F2CF8
MRHEKHQSPPRLEVTTEDMAAPSKATVVLKAVKQIAVQFCPFETNVRSTREFLALVGSEKARATNMNCEVMSTVKHDKSEPVVDITYLDGDKLVLKGAKLTSSEMLNAFQSLCTAKDPQGKVAAKK